MAIDPKTTALLLIEYQNDFTTRLENASKLIERCFGEKLKDGGWSAKLKELIPSYGQSLAENTALCRRIRAETAALLNINNVTEKESVTV